MTFFHYTCAHSVAGIRNDGLLRPNVHPLFPEVGGLVWLTDLDVPDTYALGLTSLFLQCDRTEYRVVVDPADTVRWPVFARRIPRTARWELESAPGALPMHWWLAAVEVPVLGVESAVPS